MNSEQLRLFINGAFGNEADARKVRAALAPYLRQTFDEIRSLIDLLPDESLARQREWRALLATIEEKLLPYNDAFAIELARQLPLSGAAAAEETTLMLKSVVPRTAGLVPPELIMADSTKFLLQTKVGNQRVLGMFAPVEGKSPFTTSIRRSIDRIVTGGIIRGEETKVIAAKMIPQLNKQMASQAMALARTAIQDYNRQVKEEVWNANRDAFARLGLKYEWVSALDSRTCPTCAPLDGAVKDSKKDFPLTPVHVNCRCTVVLVDPEDPGQVRYGQVISDDPLSGEGTYKTQKRINGKDWNRQNREVKTVNGKSPRYADWLAQMARKRDKASIDTLREFFGGGNAGNARADTFYKDIKKGKSPQQALIDLTNRVDSNKKVTSAKGVARRFKPADTDQKLRIANPEREQREETLFLAPEAKVKAKGTSAFVSPTDSLDTSLSNGRAVLKDVGGKDLPAIQSAVADYRSSFAAYKKNPADPKAQAKLQKALDSGAPAMERFIKRLEETPAGMKRPNISLTAKDVTDSVQKQAQADVDRHINLFNGKNVVDKSLKKIEVDGKARFDESFYIPRDKKLVVGTKGKYAPEVLHHEMAHALEVADPKNLKLAQEFRRKRAKGPADFIRLSDEEFDMDMRYTDEWINGYVGMDYKGLAEMMGSPNVSDETEVISIGVEYLTKSPQAALELLARDPDHFALILSLTRLK